MTCSIGRAGRQLLADGRDGDPGRLLEREAADPGAERREGDARGPDLAGAGHRAADGGLDDRPLVRRSRSSETAWMTTLAASLPAGVTIGLPSGTGRLADGRELDRVAAGPLERAADPGRHPERQIGRVHDRVDLQVADIAVPESRCAPTSPLRSVSVRRPTGPAAAWYTRGSRRAMPVTTSQVFVVRSRARSAAVIRSSPAPPSSTNSSATVDRWSRDVGHVGHDRVHRDVADERDAPRRGRSRRPGSRAAATSRRRSRAGGSRSGSGAWSGTSARS